MSVSKALVYLIIFKPENLDIQLEGLLSLGVEFEVLSPERLKGPWQQVQTLGAVRTDNTESLQLLASVLDNYTSRRGLLASLTDTRLVGTSADVQRAAHKRTELLQLATWLQAYKELEQAYQDYAKLKKRLKNQTLAVGLGIASFDAELAEFVGNTCYQFQQNHPNESDVSFEPPVITLQPFGKYTAILYQPVDAHIVQSFLATGKYTGQVWLEADYVEYLKQKKQELRQQLQSLGVDPEHLEITQLRELAACHAALQNEDRINDAKSKIFKVADQAEAYFLFVAVNASKAKLLERFWLSADIVFETVDWPEEIVEWRQSGDLESFRTIPASLGTIGETESDPTLVTAIIFSIFFAFCLSDALYGLIVALVCGGLLFFTRVKPGLQHMLTIFFWSGLATIVYGALTKSWAGDLFERTPLSQPLASLQLLNPLTLNTPESNPVLNTLLIEAGNIHPIVALLGFSLVVGLITVLVGYILRLNTAVRSHNWLDLTVQLTWIGFLSSLLVWLLATYIQAAWRTAALVSLSVFTIGLFIFNSGRGLFGKIMAGLASLYGLISFGSDVLSFTRLVAVGLTSGIIANVINLLTFMVYDSITIPVVNIVVAAVMLLVGHTFNLVIALFGAYINPLRLNYVEFYPKFFEGKGRPIQTLQTDFTYLRVVRST